MLEHKYTAVVIGAWGDAIASYAHISLVTTLTPIKKVQVIYYGLDPTIIDFFRIQDNIEKAIYIKPKNKDEYIEIAKESGNTNKMDWLHKIYQDVDLSSVIPTHLNAFNKTQGIYIRNFDYTLPKTQFNILPHSILFNPYSMQSVPLRGHWHYIPDALDWLLAETDWNIVLIGQEKYHHAKHGDMEFPLFVKHDRVLNLVGKTNSMVDVFAACEKCDGILTTSNSLSMWSIVAKKPAIVFLNGMLDNPLEGTSFHYFKKWIDIEPNTFIRFGDDLPTFKKVFLLWQQQLKSEDN